MDDVKEKQSLVDSNRILYTPSGFARNSLLYLQETGKLTALQGHTSKRSDLKSYLCFVVLKGSGKLVYEQDTYELKMGDCVWVDCQRDYSHSTNGKDLWSLQWVHFYGEMMPQIYEKYRERGGNVVFHPKEGKAFLAVLEELHVLADSSDYIRDMRINQKLSELLTLLMAESWHPERRETKGKHASLKDIKAYLDENYCEKITLDQLAGKYFINKYYLTRIFKETYGITINHYILTKKISYAKRLLRFSKKSMEEIGEEAGFSDAQYFCRMFKKIEGMTPGEYRKSW